jgi:hypothetical protein
MPTDFTDNGDDNNEEFFNSLPFPANSPNYPDHAGPNEKVPEDDELRNRIMGFDKLNDDLNKLAKRLERRHLGKQFNQYIPIDPDLYPKKFVDPRDIDPPV